MLSLLSFSKQSVEFSVKTKRLYIFNIKSHFHFVFLAIQVNYNCSYMQRRYYTARMCSVVTTLLVCAAALLHCSYMQRRYYTARICSVVTTLLVYAAALLHCSCMQRRYYTARMCSGVLSNSTTLFNITTLVLHCSYMQRRSKQQRYFI